MAMGLRAPADSRQGLVVCRTRVSSSPRHPQTPLGPRSGVRVYGMSVAQVGASREGGNSREDTVLCVSENTVKSKLPFVANTSPSIMSAFLEFLSGNKRVVPGSDPGPTASLRLLVLNLPLVS